jgi:hypothetical protein
VTSHTITASDLGQPLAPIAGLGCRALAGSRLLVVPDARHSLEALETSAVLLTVAKLP